MIEEVQLLIDGVPFTGWERLEIRRSLRAIAGQFSFNVAESRSRFLPSDFFGREATITANGDVVMRGWLEKYDRDVTAKESVDIPIGGISRMADIAVASADYFELHGATPLAVIQRVAEPFGVRIINRTGTAGQPFETYRVNPGQKAYQVIEDGLSRMRSAHAVENANGELELFSTSRGNHPGAAIEDARAIKVRIDGSRYFSEYIVYGTSEARTPEAQISGQQGLNGRYRPIRLHPKGIQGEGAAERYAERYARRTRGRATEVGMTFAGWRAAQGEIWQLGYILPIDIPEIELQQEMIVTDLVLSQSTPTGGTQSSLTFEPMDAFLADEPAKDLNRKRGARKPEAASTPSAVNGASGASSVPFKWGSFL